jgi:hypothetical protein
MVGSGGLLCVGDQGGVGVMMVLMDEATIGAEIARKIRQGRLNGERFADVCRTGDKLVADREPIRRD